MKLEALYKRSTTGKTSFLQIEVEGNKFRTESGFLHGKKVISDWTECKPKSYCTAEEQAWKQASAIQKKKIESGMFTNIDEIDNKSFISPMLAKDYNDYKDKIKFPLASQKKLDGVRSIIKKDGMWSRTGKKIISAPHIFESLKPLFESNPDLILDGELFALKESCDFNKIISCVKKTKPTPEDLIESEEYIQYWVYDCPSIDDIFSARILFLESLNLPKYCILNSTEIVNNKYEMMELYKQYINDGFEGQMLRILGSKYEYSRSKCLLKHKEFLDKEYKILGVKEGIGKLQGKVGTLIFDKFESSVNGTHEYLEELWKNKDELVGQTATIKYFELTSDGIPRFPKVIQIGRETYE